ncbi:MaoC family dehydratase N-terminal domain-containing protein [Burkholderia multivorans]|uniref:FAS1-like dehydratase domain-containing protein n=1 Tax=Burkholderia multivorans TaxID=87883 RepID=UPI000D381CD8|nr:MaoC family dehydratase N-terminal domain-containing protein [Burkholderia multivorans]MBR8021338.1 MaoC family dehydratase N-terminal domain-containing protein [Burkholderia multivorans]MEB2511853.1 MaoC family dehydratase N-terminal domain-containing protein [Burkholderia multivorans]MEB2521451.1 MaoC family dehydratase N-terminal domain-containing protein [Burkholderia multivorans]MEB2575326.1 MaoC family dehydratase N-terminal domain-containing protein [Burkholderia multivorans]MEB25940
MTGEQPESFDAWIGRREDSVDRITPAPIRLLRATLDDAEPSALPDALPPLWHWLYFLPGERQSNIGTDGHARRGGFLPPVALPRRMWAGGRLQFVRPLAVDTPIQRRSTIANVQSKSGRSGQLVFVTVLHEIGDAHGVAIREEQDIVYRDAPPPAAAGTPAPAAPTAPTDEQYSRIVTPDPVLLMRFSALTFNGHRIHYDRPYAMEEEGYPGLVVHGPLIAMLLMEELRRRHPGKTIRAFDFKAVSPLFDTAPFTVNGKLEGHTARVWARGPQGQLAMQANIELE